MRLKLITPTIKNIFKRFKDKTIIIISHRLENMDLFDFEISDEDMKQINTIPQVGWSGEHPDRERVPAIVV